MDLIYGSLSISKHFLAEMQIRVNKSTKLPQTTVRLINYILIQENYKDRCRKQHFMTQEIFCNPAGSL